MFKLEEQPIDYQLTIHFTNMFHYWNKKRVLASWFDRYDKNTILDAQLSNMAEHYGRLKVTGFIKRIYGVSIKTKVA